MSFVPGLRLGRLDQGPTNGKKSRKSGRRYFFPVISSLCPHCEVAAQAVPGFQEALSARLSLPHPVPGVTVRQSLPPSTATLVKEPHPDLSVSRNKQQQQKQQETTQKSLVNCKSKQMCSNLLVFQREIKTSPFALPGERQECLPGSAPAFLARCSIPKEKHLFPLLALAASNVLCVT